LTSVEPKALPLDEARVRSATADVFPSVLARVRLWTSLAEAASMANEEEAEDLVEGALAGLEVRVGEGPGLPVEVRAGERPWLPLDDLAQALKRKLKGGLKVLR